MCETTHNTDQKAAIMKVMKHFVIVSLLAPLSVISLPGMGDNSAFAGCSDSAVPGVDWSDCRKRNLIMSGSDLSDANLVGADMSSSDLRDTNLTNANVTKANLVRASLKGAKAKGADFSRILASRSDLSNSDFTDANFSKAETSRVNFSGSAFNGADMSKAEFARADFTDSDISGVNFDFSNLARADLRGARFEDAPSFNNTFMYQTRLEGLDLSKAEELQQWQVSLACGDEDTILPQGIERPDNWPCADDS